MRTLPIQEKMKLYREALRLHGEKGWGKKRIARALGISESTVNMWLYSGTRPNGWQRYIEIKPSPALSYVIGVFYGDGWIDTYVNRRQRCTTADLIGLTAVDMDFLEEFNKQLCLVLGNRKRYAYVRQGRNRQGKNQWRVRGSSRQLFDFLNQKIERHKEFIECYPAEFLRGFFDSEGGANISPNNYTYRVYCFNSDKGLLKYLKELLSKLGIHSEIYKLYEKGTVGEIRGRTFRRAKDGYQLIITQASSLVAFHNAVGFSIQRKQRVLNNIVA